MSHLTQRFECVIPAGTPEATPVTIAMTFPPMIVQRLRVRVPSGPAGNMGWAIGAGGTAIVPRNAGAWMVMDDEAFEIDHEIGPNAGSWELFGWNTGTYPHTVYVTFFGDPPAAVASGAFPQPVTV